MGAQKASSTTAEHEDGITQSSTVSGRSKASVVIQEGVGSDTGSHTSGILGRLRHLFGSRPVRLSCQKTAPESFSSTSAECLMPQTTWSIGGVPVGHIPAGSVQLALRIESAAYPLTGKLYYRVGDAFTESEFIWISLDGHSGTKPTVTLPPGVQEFRLVLYAEASAVSLNGFSVRKVGILSRILSRLYVLTRYHIRHPWVLVAKLEKAFILLRRGGWRAVRDRIYKRDNYPEWIARYDTITDRDREQMREHLHSLPYQPLISILLPVYNVPERYLRAAIESVRKQVYSNWELCIADDNSPNARVREVIAEYAQQDARIKFLFREENGHISEATNSAATLAEGEFIGLLDHDDELREHALYMVVNELQKHRDADLLFSDEDKITEDGARHDPYFKSDWNPELFLCHNCVCHFTVVRSSIFKAIGGFRKGFDGAQDWDLVLRVSESTTREKIRHIPHILYHWRVIEGSTAKETSAKPYVTAAQIKSVSEHLERRGDGGATVESIPAISMLRVRYKTPQPQPLVSLIIPTYNQVGLLEQCLDGILHRTNYTNIEVIIVDNRSDDPKTLAYLKELSARDSRVSVLRDEQPFNFSRLNNRAVAVAKGTIIGFLNNDIQVTHPEWLDEMVSNLVRKDIAAVGARLLFPNGTLQHMGVITGIGGVAGHMMKCMPMNSFGYFCRAILPQNLSAVTAACMLVKRDLFNAVGGFDEESLAVAFNDVDLCLKLRREGHLIVVTPYAELLHHESISRGYEDTPEKKARFKREYAAMQKRWGRTLVEDPYYNPNLSLEKHDVVLGFPPSGTRPWKLIQGQQA